MRCAGLLVGIKQQERKSPWGSGQGLGGASRTSSTSSLVFSELLLRQNPWEAVSLMSRLGVAGMRGREI